MVFCLSNKMLCRKIRNDYHHVMFKGNGAINVVVLLRRSRKRFVWTELRFHIFFFKTYFLTLICLARDATSSKTSRYCTFVIPSFYNNRFSTRLFNLTPWLFSLHFDFKINWWAVHILVAKQGTKTFALVLNSSYNWTRASQGKRSRHSENSLTRKTRTKSRRVSQTR